ncbi:MAG: type IVB secretion system protein IcmQ [Gammaproteobacteria bacterium]|nr:type IVB secretion system protein IcmQ [Gammaproteobacteria bacterium]
MTMSHQDRHHNLIQLIRSLLQQDNDLREKYQVGNRFIFVRNGLQALLSELEACHPILSAESKKEEVTSTSQLATVYIYLYNAQGIQVRTWAALLTPKALYEHSVNRPVFFDKKSVEDVLRSKSNVAQHAYLTMHIAEDDIIPPLPEESGIPAIKVREGSLKLEQLISLTHNGQEYILDVQGELVKKT